MRVTPNGMAALTFGPEDTPLPVEQPYLMIVSQTARPPAEVHQNFARSAFAQFAGPTTRVVSEEAIRIGSEPGYQIIGESRDERTGDELVTVVWMRFGLWGYVQMAGFARKDKWDEIFPADARGEGWICGEVGVPLTRCSTKRCIADAGPRFAPGMTLRVTYSDSSVRRRLRGVTQVMFWFGSLMSQVLQWTQFCALIW